ncbi:MAG TPA: nitroreductase, partial [Polyangia bacterium]
MLTLEPRESEFASQVTAAEQLAFATRYATLAPSSHNSQPWRFVVDGNRLELKADRTRALRVVDPDDRELTISCGAALYHLRVALRYFGLLPSVELQPSSLDPDLLAVVRIEQQHARTAADEELFHAIPRRHTNRAPFDARRPPERLVHALVAAAREHGAWLDVTSGLAKEAVAALVADGDRRQLANPAFRRELASWIRTSDDDSGDGMPAEALGLSDLSARVVPLILRRFDIGGGHAARDHELAVGSPLLAVLGSDGNREVDWVNAGQALAHVLLRA